ncbi:alpha/beta fold hydrolase [Mycobacterium sp. pUA109]|uniref:alpha/beta fold hydrolase n=1 Tax=Mycobacterium sp. pUA109 TaxID=3238982 RepID=UPI00351B3C8D
MTSTGAADNPEEGYADVGCGIRLWFRQSGPRNGPALFLLSGLGQQFNAWPDECVEQWTSRGFRVTRIDNRDVGLSTHMAFPPPNLLDILRGDSRAKQYELCDMARDTVKLMDALGTPEAHLVGVSMGGMIAQTVAADYPGRTATLTSVSSSPGGLRFGRPALSTLRRMATARPARNRQEAMDKAVSMFRHIGSRGYPFDENRVGRIAAESFDRDPTTSGIARQLAAILASGDRSRELRYITAPTLVIHGDKDRMVHPSGGVRVARMIPGAQLVTLPGLGHDLPEPLWPTIVDLVGRHAGGHRLGPDSD